MKNRQIMTMCKQKTVAVALVVIVLALSATQSFAAYVDKVLVIVNEDVITQSELDYRVAIIQQDLAAGKAQELPTNLAKQVLEGLISDKLQLQEADRRGIEISDAEVAGSIELYAKERSLTVEQLRQTTRNNGLSYAAFKQSVHDSLLLSRLGDYYARVKVSVPDYEVDGFIAQNNMSESDTEYRIAHILFSNPEEDKAAANDLLIALNDGLDFSQAAAKYSDANDAEEGGIIGWRKLEQLPEIFAQAIKEMQTGDVSDVLASPNGLHILKVLEQKGKRNEITQTQVQHILINAKGKVAVAQAKKRVNELRQRALNGEEFSQLARIYSDDSVSAANGGDLGWVSPNEMVPSFEQAFDQLKLNELSLPVATQFGVHLVKVLDRRQKNISDRLVRARAENILRRQRANREFSQWVRQLREQAYIEYIDAAI